MSDLEHIASLQRLVMELAKNVTMLHELVQLQKERLDLLSKRLDLDED